MLYKPRYIVFAVLESEKKNEVVIMKKLLSIIVALMLLVGLPGTIYAAEDTSDDISSGGGNAVDYTYIAYARCGLEITGNGLAECEASMLCYSAVNKIRISAYLQRYNGGWQTVKSWVKYAYSDYCAWGAGYYVTSGYTYRLYCYYYAYIDDSIVESTSCIVYDSY